VTLVFGLICEKSLKTVMVLLGATELGKVTDNEFT